MSPALSAICCDIDWDRFMCSFSFWELRRSLNEFKFFSDSNTHKRALCKVSDEKRILFCWPKDEEKHERKKTWHGNAID